MRKALKRLAYSRITHAIDSVHRRLDQVREKNERIQQQIDQAWENSRGSHREVEEYGYFH